MTFSFSACWQADDLSIKLSSSSSSSFFSPLFWLLTFRKFFSNNEKIHTHTYIDRWMEKECGTILFRPFFLTSIDRYFSLSFERFFLFPSIFLSLLPFFLFWKIRIRSCRWSRGEGERKKDRQRKRRNEIWRGKSEKKYDVVWERTYSTRAENRRKMRRKLELRERERERETDWTRKSEESTSSN